MSWLHKRKIIQCIQIIFVQIVNILLVSNDYKYLPINFTDFSKFWRVLYINTEQKLVSVVQWFGHLD